MSTNQKTPANASLRCGEFVRHLWDVQLLKDGKAESLYTGPFESREDAKDVLRTAKLYNPGTLFRLVRLPNNASQQRAL